MNKMKKFALYSLLIISVFVSSCADSADDKLSKAIEKIKSLKHYSYLSLAKYGDGVNQDYKVNHASLFKVISDPSDSIIGARWLLYGEDTSDIKINYHQYVATNYFSYNKTVELDTINSERPTLASPMPLKVLSLLNYYVKMKDSMEMHYSDFGDSTSFSFTIDNKNVLFWNMRPEVITKRNITSKYIVWFNKESLPYKLEQYLDDLSDIETIKYLPQMKASEVLDKQKYIYIPPTYKLVDKCTRTPVNFYNDLIGKKIIDMDLITAESKVINLSKLKNNLLIEFTSISCGPCRLALPFLKNFSKHYKNNDISVISIETYPYTKDQLLAYKKAEEIEYNYLVANKKLNDHYKIILTPLFLLVNRKGVIQKVITGYEKDVTDKEIIKYAKTL